MCYCYSPGAVEDLVSRHQVVLQEREEQTRQLQQEVNTHTSVSEICFMLWIVPFLNSLSFL